MNNNLAEGVRVMGLMIDRLHADLAIVSESLQAGVREELTEDIMVELTGAWADLKIGLDSLTEPMAYALAAMTVHNPALLLRALAAKLDSKGTSEKLEAKLGEVNPFAKAGWDAIPE